MKIKTNYINAEFKERQESFEFYCAQAFEFLLKFRKECRAGWTALFSSKKIQLTEQMEICFSTIKTLTEWTTWTPTKNNELFA